MKRVKSVFWLCLFILMNGCNQTDKQITQEEWLEQIAVQFYDADEISNWQEILLEYHVIEDLSEISDQNLTQDYAAKILWKAASLDQWNPDEENKENLQSICLELGIFDDVEKENNSVTKEEAKQWINQAYQCWLNPIFENQNLSTFKEDFLIIEDPNSDFKEIEENSVIFMQSKQNPIGSFYRIRENKGENILEEIEFTEIIESIDLTFQDELDFSDAIILDMTESESEVFEAMSTMTLTSKTFEWEGFKITWRLLNNGIKAMIEKKEDGVIITDQISIGNIIPSIRWKSSLTQIEHAFIKLNYTASNTLSVEKELLSGSYFDAKEIMVKNWQIDLNALAKKTSSVFEQIIPLAKILVPLPNAPYLNIELVLQAKLSANGEVNIVVSSSGLIGFEIINNKIRFLDEVVKNATCDINANLSALLQIQSGLNLIHQSLADFSFELGVGATMSMIGHLKNANGQISDALIGVGSLNILSDLIHASSDQEILICGDLSAHWIAKLNINSKDTLAYRFGLNLSKSLLNENNAPLFDQAKIHIENFKFVDQCTWNPAKKKNTISYLDINSYQYSIKVGEAVRVEIINLPSDTSRSDLRFVSLDESIATINETGILQGISEGSTRILVKTEDESYQISAAVIVIPT